MKKLLLLLLFLAGTIAFAACNPTKTPSPIGTKEVRNIIFFEVNNVNPLNALEYRTASGEPFFDVVVLFSSNVNYNATDDEVYVHHNPNCQALLDAADTYIAPLQEAGIAVYLSVLGNHDASGVAQLSTEGARMLAKDIAQTLERYDLDGVCFDDEYSKAPDLTNPLFADRSAEAGSRLLYETKKLIGDKKVLIYEYGMLYAAGLTEIDGTAPSQFVDIIVPDYTKTSHPIEGMTNADCAGYAVELNLGRGHGAATVEQAQRIKAEGYGWYMWFGLDPMARESVYASNLTALNDVCIGLYDRELAVPTHFYKKTSEGVYDSTRYAF